MCSSNETLSSSQFLTSVAMLSVTVYRVDIFIKVVISFRCTYFSRRFGLIKIFDLL